MTEFCSVFVSCTLTTVLNPFPYTGTPRGYEMTPKWEWMTVSRGENKYKEKRCGGKESCDFDMPVLCL